MTDPALGLSLTLGASLAWAGLDALRKVLVQRLDPVALLVLLTLGQLPPFAIWAWSSGQGITSVAYVVPGIASLALNIAANLLFFRAVRLSPLSLTIPLLAFVPVFTVLAANPLLGELPQPRQIVGIVIVVAGALALGSAGAKSRSPWAFARGLLREPGSLPMLGTALCWSLTIVVDKLATAHAGYGAHAMVLSAGIAVCGLLILLVRGKLRELAQVKNAWKPMLAAVAMGAIGLGAQLVAVNHLIVAVVESTKRAIGVTMSVIVGRVAFGEAVTSSKIVAVALMAIGAGTIVWEVQ